MGNATSTSPTKQTSLSSPRYPTQQQQQQMISAETHQALKESWEHIETVHGQHACITMFYERMLRDGGDSVRRLFLNTNMAKQEHMLSSVVSWALDRRFTGEGLQRLGVYHAHLGVSRGDFDLFRTSFVRTLAQLSGEYWKPVHEDGWNCIFSLLSDAMLGPMEETQKLLSSSLAPSAVEAEARSAHEHLLAWISESSVGQDPIAPKIDCSGTLQYHCNELGKVRTEPKIRRVELVGRVLYVSAIQSGAVVRAIDLSCADLVDDPEQPFSFYLRSDDLVHHFTAEGDTKKENWIVGLTKALKQFHKSIPVPDPNMLSSDEIVSQLVSAKKQLKFTPTDFKPITLLGRGSFGKVLKVQHKSTGRVYAMKVVDKASFKAVRHIVEVRRERAILENLDHPFIVKFYGVFQSPTRLYLLFDFLSGGELFTHMKNAPDHHFDEVKAKFYLAEIATAVDHLHKNSIIHRDIKGDNFVLDANGHVVLTDFGFAKVVDPSKRNTATCGTLAYIAPEVITPSPLGYGYSVDWWSVGVVLFTMLTGFFPFLRQHPTETARAITRDALRFPPRPVLSPEAMSLCQKLLEKKVHERIKSLEELEAHPWYAGFDWATLKSGKAEPPFVPDHRGSNTKYFAPKFTTQQLTAALDEAVPDHSFKREQDVFSSFFAQDESRGSDVSDTELSSDRS